MLRNHQFPYDVAQQAVRFYIDHAHRLPDITPGRFVLIATVIRDAGSNKLRRDARLEQMLRSGDQRPKLILEPSMVQALYWPKKPPKRKRPPPDRGRSEPVPLSAPPPPAKLLLLPPPEPRTDALGIRNDQ